MLEWVAISSSRGSFWPRDRTRVSCTGRWILYLSATWETQRQQYSINITFMCSGKPKKKKNGTCFLAAFWFIATVWNCTCSVCKARLYLQLNLCALFRSSSGHFNPHFWRERGRMIYLTSHSLADLGLWTLSPEFCPLPHPCLWDRVVKSKMGRCCRSGCSRKVAKVKKHTRCSPDHLSSSPQLLPSPFLKDSTA